MFEIGKVYIDTNLGEGDVIRIVRFEDDHMLFDVVADPNERWSSTIKTISQELADMLEYDYVELPGYDTPLYRLLNG
jgi:hypothetical protein